MTFSLAISPVSSPFAPLFFQGELERGLALASEYGYDAVELSLGSPDDIDVPAVRAALRTLRLGVSAVATGQLYYRRGLSLLDSDSDRRARCVEELKTLLRTAAALEAPFLIIGGVRGRWPEEGAGDGGRAAARRWLVDGLGELASAAREEGMGLLLEPINRYETDCIGTVADALAVIDDVGMPNIRLLVDTFHANLEERSIVGALLEAGDKLAYVHVADSNRRIPGDGSIAFSTVFSVLHQLKFQGTVGVEALPKPNSSDAAARAIAFCRHFAVHNAEGGGQVRCGDQ